MLFIHHNLFNFNSSNSRIKLYSMLQMWNLRLWYSVQLPRLLFINIKLFNIMLCNNLLNYFLNKFSRYFYFKKKYLYTYDSDVKFNNLSPRKVYSRGCSQDKCINTNDNYCCQENFCNKSSHSKNMHLTVIILNSVLTLKYLINKL